MFYVSYVKNDSQPKRKEKEKSPSKYIHLFFIFFNPHLNICLLILEREEGRGEERNMIGCLPYMPYWGIEPAIYVCALTGNWARSQVVYGVMHQPNEPPGQGYKYMYMSVCI